MRVLVLEDPQELFEAPHGVFVGPLDLARGWMSTKHFLFLAMQSGCQFRITRIECCIYISFAILQGVWSLSAYAAQLGKHSASVLGIAGEGWTMV